MVMTLLRFKKQNLPSTGDVFWKKRLTSIIALALQFIVTLILANGCDDGFAKYSEIEGFRVLAIRSEKPWIAPGERTEISALAIARPGADLGEDIDYEWSWCPVLLGPNQGYKCALDSDSLKEVTGQDISLDLGTNKTAQFAHLIPPEALRQVCQTLREQATDTFVNQVDCLERFPIYILLTATAGEQTIVSVKKVQLLYQADEKRNNNPALADILAKLGEDENLSPLDPNAPTPMKRDRSYEIEVGINPDQAQTFESIPIDGNSTPETRTERLVFSWFIEGGTLDEDTRTIFLDGETDFDDVRANLWNTPRQTDFSSDRSRIYVVVRDERDGTSWLTRDIKWSNK